MQVDIRSVFTLNISVLSLTSPPLIGSSIPCPTLPRPFPDQPERVKMFQRYKMTKRLPGKNTYFKPLKK